MVAKSKNSSSNSDRLKIICQVLTTNKGVSTHRRTNNASEDLSDIDDAEILGYLNNKKEFLLKKIIWEAMNKERLKRRQPKHSIKKKETAPAKKIAKAIDTTETKKKLSSKINYDALDKLFDSEEVPKRSRLEAVVDSDQNDNRELHQSDKPTLSESQCFEESTDKNDEFGNEREYSEDNMYEDGEYYSQLDLENEDEDGGYYDDENYDGF